MADAGCEWVSVQVMPFQLEPLSSERLFIKACWLPLPANYPLQTAEKKTIRSPLPRHMISLLFFVDSPGSIVTDRPSFKPKQQIPNHKP